MDLAVIFYTRRLLLREFLEDDWRSVLEYQSDPLFQRYAPWCERTEADARDFVHAFMACRDEQPRCRFQLAIVLPSSERLIGSCGIHMTASGSGEAEIGYELASSYWGQGMATEAARSLLAFGFWHLRLHRIWAQCLAEHVASARVLQKIGMRREGCWREQTWLKGRWWDRLIFAILYDEWRVQIDGCAYR